MDHEVLTEMEFASVTRNWMSAVLKNQQQSKILVVFLLSIKGSFCFLLFRKKSGGLIIIKTKSVLHEKKVKNVNLGWLCD